MDDQIKYALDILTSPWFSSIISLLAGAIISFIITSYFSDHPTDIVKKSATFPTGSYILTTYSRSEPFIYLDWNVIIERPGRFRSPIMKMSLLWRDNFGVQQLWQYKGFAHRRSTFSMALLNFVPIASKEQSGGVLSPAMSDDSCFVTIANETENWAMRPCLISSFDEHGNCFSALGILRRADFDASEAIMDDLTPLIAHLDYKGLRQEIMRKTRAA